MKTAIATTQQQFHPLAAHFLALDSGDRFLRFGWTITDSQIVHYVESLLAAGDDVYAVIEPDGEVSGVLHLESMGCGVTVGLTVTAWARRAGIGTLLLRQATEHARAHGLRTLFVRNLNLHTALRRLALRLHLKVACTSRALACRPLATGGAGGNGRDEPITLADDSLRAQWSGDSPGAALIDLPRPLALSPNRIVGEWSAPAYTNGVDTLC